MSAYGVCRCVLCCECEGKGALYRAFGGGELRRQRLCDSDERETCFRCNGLGVDEVCDSCQALEEDEMRRLEMC